MGKQLIDPHLLHHCMHLAESPNLQAPTKDHRLVSAQIKFLSGTCSPGASRGGHVRTLVCKRDIAVITGAVLEGRTKSGVRRKMSAERSINKGSF